MSDRLRHIGRSVSFLKESVQLDEGVVTSLIGKALNFAAKAGEKVGALDKAGAAVTKAGEVAKKLIDEPVAIGGVGSRRRAGMQRLAKQYFRNHPRAWQKKQATKIGSLPGGKRLSVTD